MRAAPSGSRHAPAPSEVRRRQPHAGAPQLCADDEVVVAATPAADTPKAPPPGFPLTDAAYQDYVKRFGRKAAKAMRSAVSKTNQRRWAAGKRSGATPKARAAMQNNAPGVWYGYGLGRQTLPWTSGTIGLYGSQTIEDPFFNTPEGGHTLGQLWAIDGTPGGFYSDVEMGWTEDPVTFAGTANPWAPHLFVFSFDGGIPGCYNGCPSGRGYFHSAGASVYPGMQLGCCGSVLQFAIQRYGTNWWVNVAGTWVGYFPQSSYPSYFNYGLTTLEAGGEVATTTTTTSCSDMGNGQQASSASSAHWENIYRVTGSGDVGGVGVWAALGALQSDPSAWTVAVGSSGTFLRYGGWGYC